MNDLIRELARQAGLTRLREGQYSSMSDEQLEKLVKLILIESAGKNKKELARIFNLEL